MSASGQPIDREDEPQAPTNAGNRRAIRSFVTRAGRISPAQQRAIDTMRHSHCIAYSSAPLDFAAVFERVAPTVLEIGFGMGAATAEIASARPDVDFIGVEVHVPGIGALLKLIAEHGIANLRIVEHDAVEVVRQMIPAASLAGVHIFFPDQWHKARHHKRRLLNPAIVSLLASRLTHGGYLHCATDWEHYADQMLEVLSAESTLANAAGAGYASPKNPLATRPTTKFETRGLKLGHGVWDLIFVKR